MLFRGRSLIGWIWFSDQREKRVHKDAQLLVLLADGIFTGK